MDLARADPTFVSSSPSAIGRRGDGLPSRRSHPRGLREQPARDAPQVRPEPQRTQPRLRADRSALTGGVTYVTVGTGGGSLESVHSSGCLWQSCPPPAWSVTRYMHFGVLKLVFGPTSISASSSAACRRGSNDITCNPGDVIDTFHGSVDDIGEVVDESCAPGSLHRPASALLPARGAEPSPPVDSQVRFSSRADTVPPAWACRGRLLGVEAAATAYGPSLIRRYVRLRGPDLLTGWSARIRRSRPAGRWFAT